MPMSMFGDYYGPPLGGPGHINEALAFGCGVYNGPWPLPAELPATPAFGAGWIPAVEPPAKRAKYVCFLYGQCCVVVVCARMLTSLFLGQDGRKHRERA